MKSFYLFSLLILFLNNLFAQKHSKIGNYDKMRKSIFLQEGVTVPNKQSSPAFSPDGKNVFLADNDTIKVSHLINGRWTKPTVADFSGQWPDWDPALSPDGKKLVFVSMRPALGSLGNVKEQVARLWSSSCNSKDTWESPQELGYSINLPYANSYGPSLSRNLTLYFCSSGRDSAKYIQTYFAKWLGNKYSVVQKISIPGIDDIFDPLIAPDESYLIFKHGFDLYITFKKEANWQTPIKLNDSINDGGYNLVPKLSPDKKTLYYNSSKVKGILSIPFDINTINAH